MTETERHEAEAPENFDLRTSRLNAGHTITSLAAVLKMHPLTLQRIENGEGARPANLKKIADHFKVKVVDLLPDDKKAAA
jgi:transcriptional regulator with XRE-family HTH domain